MLQKYTFQIAIVGVLLAILASIVFMSPRLALEPAFNSMLALVFPELVTPATIRNHYYDGRMRVLIVPGHDKDSGGTDFGGIFERDVNAEIGYHLSNYLSEDPRFEISLLRQRDGSQSPWFTDYVSKNEETIRNYVDGQKKIVSDLIASNEFTINNKITHKNAPSQTAFELYAINKYANDNDIDVVLHLHVNDYAGRKLSKAGKYRGFSIYVPEGQLPNSRVSNDLANALKSQLKTYIPESNFIKESTGIVEDQELIAIGSYATRDGASILLEYGYIYEPMYQNVKFREQTYKELAFQTAKGMRHYFNPNPDPRTQISLDRMKNSSDIANAVPIGTQAAQTFDSR